MRDSKDLDDGISDAEAIIQFKKRIQNVCKAIDKLQEGPFNLGENFSDLERYFHNVKYLGYDHPAEFETKLQNLEQVIGNVLSQYPNLLGSLPHELDLLKKNDLPWLKKNKDRFEFPKLPDDSARSNAEAAVTNFRKEYKEETAKQNTQLRYAAALILFGGLIAIGSLGVGLIFLVPGVIAGGIALKKKTEWNSANNKLLSGPTDKMTVKPRPMILGGSPQRTPEVGVSPERTAAPAPAPTPAPPSPPIDLGVKGPEEKEPLLTSRPKSGNGNNTLRKTR